MQKNDSNTTDREIVISRLLNAPLELVWEVWTNPEHIKNWWGPNDFTCTIHQMDVKKDGVWNLTMHGPDGTNYENQSIFKEIVKHKKIVYEHIQAKFTATIELERQGNKTQLSWRMLFETKEEFLRVIREHHADQGLKQNIEKLKTYIKSCKHNILTKQ